MERETILWNQASNKDKSYTTKLLDFFWYRNKQLKKSWRKEEVITFELLRALEILPRDYFLRPLLAKIQQAAPETQEVAKKLRAKTHEVEIHPFPNLHEKGNKRSDIGLATPQATLWIEIKTNNKGSKNLPKQIQNQQEALKKQTTNQQQAVIALLTPNYEYKGAQINWKDIKELLRNCEKKLETQDKKIVQGLTHIAKELGDRIEEWFEK